MLEFSSLKQERHLSLSRALRETRVSAISKITQLLFENMKFQPVECRCNFEQPKASVSPVRLNLKTSQENTKVGGAPGSSTAYYLQQFLPNITNELS